jgi:hypothetical protein
MTAGYTAAMSVKIDNGESFFKTNWFRNVRLLSYVMPDVISDQSMLINMIWKVG